MSGGKLRTILLCMLAALCAAGYFVGQVWKQNHFVKLSKEGASLLVRREALQSDIAVIRLDIEKLLDYSRLEKLAVRQFGLQYAGVPEFIYADPSRAR